MAKRKIIKIDAEKCTGCGVCVPNCAEGALQIIDGKARLISDLFCDGLGACIGHCPEGAITVEEREAELYNERMVMEQNIIPAGRNTIRAHLLHLRDHGAMDLLQEAFAVLREHGMDPREIVHGKSEDESCGCNEGPRPSNYGGGCPGSRVVELKKAMLGGGEDPGRVPQSVTMESELKNWPVQIHLANPYAPYFKEADLVVIADCVAYAYAETHREFIKDRVVLIGCPKLDDAGAYIDKISEIVRAGKPRSIKVVRMEVPCCGGIVEIVKQAIKKAGEVLPFEVVTITIDGKKQ